MKTLKLFPLLAVLALTAVSCTKDGTKRNDDGGTGDKPAEISITDAKSSLLESNKRSCILPGAPAKGDNHLMFLSYTSNTDLAKYNTRLRMIIKPNGGAINWDTLFAQVDSVNAETVFHNLCLYMNCGIKYVVAECRLTLNDKIKDTIVATSNSDTAIINNPRACPGVADFTLNRAELKLFALNSCTNNVGTGSNFHTEIFYDIHNFPLDIDDYYVEVNVDWSMAGGGAGSFISQPIETDPLFHSLTVSNCATFGDDATALTQYYTVALFEKLDNGTHAQNPFLISNKIGPYSISKPAGAKRPIGLRSSVSPTY